MIVNITHFLIWDKDHTAKMEIATPWYWIWCKVHDFFYGKKNPKDNN